MNEAPLAGKVVAVTGASRGLGEAMAVGLAAAGARVALLARSESDLSRVQRRCEERDGRALPIVADVTSVAALRRALRTIEREWGRLDAWFNNAALGPNFFREDYLTDPVRIAEIAVADWRKVVDVNVNGVFFCIREAVPLLASSGGGSIINISTSPSTMERLGYMPYGATKAAVQAMTRSFAVELKPFGIRVNTLAPGGLTASHMLPSVIPADFRVMPSTVMVPSAIYLASDLSLEMTGESILANHWNAENGFNEDGSLLQNS